MAKHGVQREPNQVSVKSTVQLTPNMQRLVLTGSALSSFPTNCASGYIKLLFMPDGSPVADASCRERLNGQRPTMRTYTIRAFDVDTLEMTVDFVRHSLEHGLEHDSEQSSGNHSGPAAQWAMSCQAGDTIMIAGPGDIKLVNPDADWFLLVGDMTALPALSCNLEQLPATAKGVAIIDILEKGDQQELVAPEGMEIIWVYGRDEFLATIRNLSWPDEDVAAWCACEFSTMREVRQFLKSEKGLAKEKLYISSYWKQGAAEEAHKVLKREDAEAAEQ